MKLRRLLSFVTALLLVCGLPVSVFAAEYDLAKGSITVTAKADGQYVTQADNGIVDQKEESDTVITQSDSSETSTTNTITIKAEENATANVTIQDVNIVISDDSFTNHSGEAAVTIDVADGAEANVTLDGVNIDVGGTGRNTGSEPIPGKAAVQITGNGDVTLELDGENTVQSGYRRAGVEKNDADSSGKLTITDETGTSGSLEATGGELGSGIGGGDYGSGSNITITGNAEVTATGGANGAGIGGGSRGSGSNITIEGSAEVTAKGGDSGAGIGGGILESGSDITISGDAQVKVQGGSVSRLLGAGSSIGGGGARGQDGQEVTPNTDALSEGWIATYTPGTTDLDTADPNTLTYKDANGTVKTATENITLLPAQSASADTHGHEAGFMVGNELVAVTIHNYGDYVSNSDATCTHDGTKTAMCTVPGCTATHTIPDPGSMLEHEFGEYVPDADNLATCTSDGTKTATCKHCPATDTVIDPAKNHSFTDYVSDNNATCEEDGTKTAKCDHGCGAEDTITDVGSALRHSFTNYISDNNATYDADGTKTAHCDHPGCDATDTLPDPGSKLVREEPAQTAPLYRVVGQDGKDLACKTEQSSGVLTITVDADLASLTGTLGGIMALKARGVHTIVFVTKGATSTFAIADLLAQGGDTYALTHDGSTVTFTLSDGTDIAKILK